MIYVAKTWAATRVGVNSAPELDFLANSKSNSGIGIELELALPSPGVIPCQINNFFPKFARPPSNFDEIWHTCR